VTGDEQEKPTSQSNLQGGGWQLWKLNIFNHGVTLVLNA
jgi:hypothetical protein